MLDFDTTVHVQALQSKNPFFLMKFNFQFTSIAKKWHTQKQSLANAKAHFVCFVIKILTFA